MSLVMNDDMSVSNCVNFETNKCSIITHEMNAVKCESVESLGCEEMSTSSNIANNKTAEESSFSHNWQLSKSGIKDRLRFALAKQALTDVVFLIGKEGQQREFHAHRFILSIASPVFDAMFNGPLANKESVIEIIDVEPEAFNLALQFIYTDEISISPDSVMSTLYMAKKYGLITLEKNCVQFLKQNIKSSNAFALLGQARLFDEPQLAALCLETIDKNTSEALESHDFLDIDLDTLSSVLERDTLGIRETKLFDAVCKWAEGECQRKCLSSEPSNIRAVLGESLHLVRFPLMSVEEFAAGPAQSNILTDKEKVQMFLYYHLNPKPQVEFLDNPRCCLTGKEQVVSRFCQIESRWGYSGTSDRIRFEVNRKIYVVGFGLYGSIHGAAEYSVNIQVIHSENGQFLQENNCVFQCDGSQATFRVMFKEPIEILPNVNYTASATLKGPDSYYGTKGLRKVTHESVASGKVTFNFTYASGNNNGTSVEDGQIPEIIFYT